MNKEQIKAHWIMLKERKTLEFEAWKQKHIDALIFLDENPNNDFMLFQAYELYQDCI
mgnify:FL=1|tara:strand:+ start:1293 stop:1463 length:171 start_codon:yes stop_codon:yes gene_type:complete